MNKPKYLLPKNTPLKSLVIDGRAIDYSILDNFKTQQDCIIYDDNLYINNTGFVVVSWRYARGSAVSMFIEKKHLVLL